VLHFEDPDFGLIYVATPPPGVHLETVVAHIISHILFSPVPLPLDAVLGCPADALPSLEEAFFLRAKISGAHHLCALKPRGGGGGNCPHSKAIAVARFVFVHGLDCCVTLW